MSIAIWEGTEGNMVKLKSMFMSLIVVIKGFKMLNTIALRSEWVTKLGTISSV